MGKAQEDNSLLNVSKEVFVSMIESLKLQVENDVLFSKKLSDLFKIKEELPLYDNSFLSHSLTVAISTLFDESVRDYFMSEINRFCYELNFGREQGSDLTSPEELWERLNSVKPYEYTTNCTLGCDTCSDCKNETPKEKDSPSDEEILSSIDDAFASFFTGLIKGQLDFCEENIKKPKPLPYDVIKKMRHINDCILELQDSVYLKSLDLEEGPEKKTLVFNVSVTK